MKLENKFAAVSLKVPLAGSMEDAYPLVKKASKHIKNSFCSVLMVYGQYVAIRTTSMFLSRFMVQFLLNFISNKVTLAFSNTPGPIKPFVNFDHLGRKITTLQSSTYISLPGRIGLSLASMSFSNSFKITVSADDNVLKEREVRKLAELVYENMA